MVQNQQDVNEDIHFYDSPSESCSGNVDWRRPLIFLRYFCGWFGRYRLFGTPCGLYPFPLWSFIGQSSVHRLSRGPKSIRIPALNIDTQFKIIHPYACIDFLVLDLANVLKIFFQNDLVFNRSSPKQFIVQHIETQFGTIFSQWSLY